MKKITLLASLASASLAGSVCAEELVAAWDFNYENSFGGLDVDGDFAADSSAPATYGNTAATFSWTGMGSGGGLSNSADLDTNQKLRPTQIQSMNNGFGWIVDANSSAGATLELNVDLSAYAGGTAELSFAAGSQNGPVTLDVSAGGVSNVGLLPGADALQTIDISSLVGGNATITFTFSDFTGTDNAVIDNIQVVAEAGQAGGGSLFILDNPVSVLLGDNWYYTPMGNLNVSSDPWLYSTEYGWIYSPPSNTELIAFVYIPAAPFNCWVYVDQSSAGSDGFWGYALDADVPGVSGWFFFLMPPSTSNQNSWFIGGSDGILAFPDAAQ